jgi:hypothetical protein
MALQGIAGILICPGCFTRSSVFKALKRYLDLLPDTYIPFVLPFCPSTPLCAQSTFRRIKHEQSQYYCSFRCHPLGDLVRPLGLGPGASPPTLTSLRGRLRAVLRLQPWQRAVADHLRLPCCKLGTLFPSGTPLRPRCPVRAAGFLDSESTRDERRRPVTPRRCRGAVILGIHRMTNWRRPRARRA